MASLDSVAPQNSDVLRTSVHGEPALIILTRTVSRQPGIRRWLISLDGELVGAISEHPHSWWGAEPIEDPDCTDRYRTWQQAARAVAETMLTAKVARSSEAARKPKRAKAGGFRRPQLSLVWSVTS